MSLYQRLRKKLGHDTTEDMVTTVPIYRYEITHINGNERTEVASGHLHDGAFLELKKPTRAMVFEPQFIGITVGAEACWDTVTTLEGIEQYERTEVGELRCSTTYDWASRSHDGIEFEREHYGSDPS